MSGKGYDSWSFTASILSTIFLVPLVYAWTKGPLPSTKIREMESLLLETQNLLLSAIQEGTITYQLYESKLDGEMWAYVSLRMMHFLVFHSRHILGLRCKRIPCALKYTTSKARGRSSGCGKLACRNKSLLSWTDCTRFEERLQCVITYTYLSPLLLIIPSMQTSSSRGRAELSNMGCTTNPTLAVYYSRGASASPVDCVCRTDKPLTVLECIAHLTLPALPPGACTALPPYTETHRCTLASRSGAVAVQSSPHSHLLATGSSCNPHAADAVSGEPPVIGDYATTSTVQSSLCEAHAMPSLAFPSQEKTTMERPRPVQHVPLTHENKVNHTLDARASWQAASPVPSRPRPIKGKNKNNGSNHLSVFIGIFRRSSDITLPRQTGFFSYPSSTQTTPGKGEPGMLGSGRKGVVAEVQLPV